QIIWDGLNELCRKAGIDLSKISFTLMGLAGIDHQYQYDIMCAKLREKGLENFEVYNDGFIVVKAGSETGSAIGYNCGTGVCCNGIDTEGKRMMLAGLGDFSGDISGGGNIVIKAFELVYNELFLGLEKTLITDMIMKEFGLRKREDLLGLIEKIEGENGDDYIRVFVSSFFEAAKQGDKPALEYCERMAERGARLIAALSRELNYGDGEIEVVLSGSINVKLDNKAYLDMLLEKAEKYSGKKLKFIKLTQPPVTGCINWIMQNFAN
ncbi:MAG: hypothetical protein J6R20_02810, partial [Clostridia bacterium]|nr:hypothetical protein [Clostridia bacterium]